MGKEKAAVGSGPRWDQGPSRGNDASGRNDRVLHEVVRCAYVY